MAATQDKPRKKDVKDYRREQEKYTKHFLFRAVQLIIGARLGKRTQTKTDTTLSNTYLFGLSIKDDDIVGAETKKFYSTRSCLSKHNLNVDIMIKTSDGEVMNLETWTLSFNPDVISTDQIVSKNDVYKMMCGMLKSICCIARVSPAYKYSRNQGSKSHVVLYVLYGEHPNTLKLGTDYGSKSLGKVSTGVGTITVSLAYRTKMIFSPHQSTDLSIDLKDDHFNTDLSPKKSQPTLSHKMNGRQHSNTTPVETNGDVALTAANMSPPRIIPKVRDISKGDAFNEIDRTPPQKKTGRGLIGAFVSSEAITQQPKGAFDDDVPFMSFLDEMDGNANKKNTHSKKVTVITEDDSYEKSDNARFVRKRQVSGESNRSTGSPQCAPERDFVMVDLKTPFACPDSNSELGRFYKDCQVAPALKLFEEQGMTSSQEVMNSITDQLSMFETAATEFDDFLSELHLDDR